MSKVQLQGNASGTGIFTIASPNGNTDRTLTLPDNTGTIVTTGSTGVITSSMLAAGVGGKLLQVVSVTTSTAVAFNNTFANLSGFSVSITPSATSSKILFLVTIVALVNTGTPFNGGGVRVYRNGSVMLGQVVDSNRGQISFPFTAGAGNNQPNTTTWAFLDSPSTTSSVTYSMQAGFTDGDGTGYINRTTDNTDNSENMRTQTNIFAFEVAA